MVGGSTGWMLGTGWLESQRAPEYDKPLGAPTGAASITFELANGTLSFDTLSATTAAPPANATFITVERTFASGTRAVLRITPDAVDATMHFRYLTSF